MKKFKISLFAIVAIIMGIAASAFTSRSVNKLNNDDSFFYQYTSSSTAETDIKNIDNYERQDVSCVNGSHVCGVFLPTDEPLNEQPDATEFDNVKNDLWISEQNGSAANSSITMKN